MFLMLLMLLSVVDYECYSVAVMCVVSVCC